MVFGGRPLARWREMFAVRGKSIRLRECRPAGKLTLPQCWKAGRKKPTPRNKRSRGCRRHGRGTSTPTQTAWVLEFLCEMKLQDADPVSKAVHYLLETRSGAESRRDGSVVGTGHPGILYMEYPVYPKVFPVMALANYLNPR
jgi:hypothetical protein